MNKQESTKILMEMGKTNYGTALRAHLERELEKIDDVASCNSWEETQGRAYAVKLIRGIFGFMDKDDTKKTHTNTYT